MNLNAVFLVACALQPFAGAAFALPFSPQGPAKAVPLPYASAADVAYPAMSGDPSARRPAPAHIPVSRRTTALPLYDIDETGATWAVGETYKASFGVDGATYVPFFGSRAPRNFPVTMRTQSITVGGSALTFATEVAARLEDATVTLDRGSVLEAYDIARDSIEQRYVFEALPARGEIVVSIDVASELEARVGLHGFEFGNELGHVNYGRAFAFDASGARIEIESRLVDGDIQLVVPAAFTERAVLPLTIDPYVTTVAVDADANDDLNPDVAFETGTVTSLFVYEFAFSASDHDVYADNLTSVLVIDSTTTDWRGPRVAANRNAANWLCVAAAGIAPNRIIRGRMVHVSPYVADAQFTISGTTTGDRHDPDVGGDTSLTVFGTTNYCVVWQRDSPPTTRNIFAQLVASNGTLSGGVQLGGLGANQDSNPSISKTNGQSPDAGRDWMIVFEREITPTDRDIMGTGLHFDGTSVSPVFTVSGASSDERDPAASEVQNDYGFGRRWLAIYESDSNLRVAAFSGSLFQSGITLIAPPLSSYGEPDVAIDGRLWHVTYRSTSGIFPNIDSDIMVASFASVAGNLSYAEYPLAVASSPTYDESGPRIASLIGSGNPYRCYIAFETGSASNLTDVMCAVYDSPINAGEFEYCPGTAGTCPCGNGGDGVGGCANSAVAGGARLSAQGTAFVTADTALLTATSMTPGTAALYFQGTLQNVSGSAFGDGLVCLGGAITRMGTKFGSASQYPGGGDPALHVAGGVPAAGGYRYYQAWYRDAATFCTSSTFNLTNAVALLWAP